MSAPLTAEDNDFLTSVEPGLARGLALRRWWLQAHAANSYRESFVLQRFPDPRAAGTGFADTVDVPAGVGALDIIGVVVKLSFGRLEFSPDSDPVTQLREFVLRYFLGTAAFRAPSTFSLGSFREPGSDLTAPDGWDFSRRYFKLRDSAKPGKFQPNEQERLTDLREIGTKYDWLVLRARLFDYAVDLSLFGPNGPRLTIPIGSTTTVHAVTGAENVSIEVNPAPGIAARFEFGFCLLPNPGKSWLPLLWGPGQFVTGFESFIFELLDTGEIILTSPFIAPRPTRLVGYQSDPVGAGLRLADRLSFGLVGNIVPRLNDGFDPVLTPLAGLDRLTGGYTGRLGLSVEALQRFLLDQHLMAVYRLCQGSSLLFNLVPDWNVSPDQIPAWILPPDERPARTRDL